MVYKRILTVQDISCIGQCSITVALPILSACGMEVCVLPSAILSTHTGGFGKPFVRNLTDDIPRIVTHWKSQNILFDGIYTGYLGCIQEIMQMQNLFNRMAASSGMRIVDPVMADHGRLYSGFNDDFVDAMKMLCKKADVIIPNWTEACLLTDTPFTQNPDEKMVENVVSKLCQSGIKNAVITGAVNTASKIGILILEAGKLTYFYHSRIPQDYHGTGDIFASAFTGAIMNGLSLYDSVKIAAEYIQKCLWETFRNPAHWYGIKYEPFLSELNALISKNNSERHS